MKDYKNIDEYIVQFPENIQLILGQIRSLIKEIVPEADEAIRYGIPTFRLNGNLVHFAAYKTHIGFYPGPSGIVAFEKELGEYNCSKGTIQFSIDKPIPFDLIKRIVVFRVEENRRK